MPQSDQGVTKGGHFMMIGENWLLSLGNEMPCHCEERFLRRSNPLHGKEDCFANKRLAMIADTM